MKIVQLIRN